MKLKPLMGGSDRQDMVFFGDQKIEILQVNQDRLLHNSFNFISGSSSQAKVPVFLFFRRFFLG